MRVLLLSPYHSGSHAAWGDGWRSRSRHRIDLLSLPGRFWKWRMRGAALTLARESLGLPDPDVIVATDMLDLAAFLALTRRRFGGTPVLLYMHENQLTYPLPPLAAGGGPRPAGERDLHHAFVNLTSMLAADRVAFNSEYHRGALLDALPRLLRRAPDHAEPDAVDRVAARAFVLPVGIDGAALAAGRDASGSPPLVVWNQRWEYDKNPAALFDALRAVAARGIAFELALCGERFGREPEVFARGIRDLGARVVHTGHLPRREYIELLKRSDIVVSTAEHEFFGISVLEAIAAGAHPLLPARLSYPELLPPGAHADCLYHGTEELIERLCALLTAPGPRPRVVDELGRDVVARFDWGPVAASYDAAIDALATAALVPGGE